MTDDTTPPSDDPPDDAPQSETSAFDSTDSEPLDPAAEGVDPPTHQADGPGDSPDESPETEVDSLREQLLSVGIVTGLGFGSFVIPTVVVLLPVLVIGLQFDLSIPESPLFLLSSNFLLFQGLGMGGISALYLWKTGRGTEYIDIRRPTLLESAVVIVAPFVIIVLSVIVSQLSLTLGVEPSDHAIGGLGEIDPTLFLYLIPFMLLVVGPFEELLYRGVIQGRLRESFGPLAAILLASLVFALVHVPAYGLGGSGISSLAAALSALFVGSLVFGGIYEWTENLTVVALVHGLYNSILLALLYVATVYGPELEEFAEQAEQAVVVVGL